MGVRRTFALLALVMLVGCESFSWSNLNPFESKEDPTKLAKEYRDQVDIAPHMEMVKNGKAIVPTMRLKITNTGDKTIEYMKIVMTLDGPLVPGFSYHDVRVVKPLTAANGEVTLLPRDGGTTATIVSFEKVDNAPAEAIGMFQPKVNLTEIRFR